MALRNFTFDYAVPREIKITFPMVKEALREVQAQLLSHSINGGDRKLSMERVTDTSHSCGMAACIGGWTSLFLLGYDTTRDNKLENAADRLFSRLVELDREKSYRSSRLHKLFYNYNRTEDFDEPNVAATAIERYLTGKDPWPEGPMPNILPYTKGAPAKKRSRVR